jgi:hypothetical protein
MALRVIGAGFGRTGTLSLKLALEQLGFGPCHHMEEVLHHPAQLPLWQDAAAGRAVDWDAVFAGYGAMVDWPGCNFWRELAAHWPAAKVIVSVRPEEAWWTSFSATIGTLLGMRGQIPAPHIRDTLEMGAAVIAQSFDPPTDREAALAAFRKRSADVREALPADRVLVFDVAEGWAPLCGFLGVTVPDVAFPRSNSTDEFWKTIRGEG